MNAIKKVLSLLLLLAMLSAGFAMAEEAPAGGSEASAPEAKLNGPTGRVNNLTSLADGVYEPDKFSWSGGSGRVSVSCPQITVSGGKAKATIVFSSPNYDYVKASGQKYYGSHGEDSSTFEIPVELNRNNEVIGMTTAMSTAHEVTYTMYFYLNAAEAVRTQAVSGAPEVPGLTCVSVDENDAACLFRLCRYAEGYTAIEVEGVGVYLVVPGDAELPAGVEEEMPVIRRPVKSLYAATEEIYARIEFCGAAAAVKLAGFDAGDALVCAGSCAELDYAALLKEKCDLAIVPEAFADGRVCGSNAAQRCAELSDEGAAALADAAERLGMLGISMFVDRAMDEESGEACLEWLKVYGVLLDCEAEAVAAYEAAVA